MLVSRYISRVKCRCAILKVLIWILIGKVLAFNVSDQHIFCNTEGTQKYSLISDIYNLKLYMNKFKILVPKFKEIHHVVFAFTDVSHSTLICLMAV